MYIYIYIPIVVGALLLVYIVYKKPSCRRVAIVYIYLVVSALLLVCIVYIKPSSKHVAIV